MKQLGQVCVAMMLLTLVAAESSKAQVEFNLGPKLGLNFATVSFSPDLVLAPGVTKGGRTTFMIGAFGELGFLHMFYVALEPGYVSHGFVLTQGAATQTVSASYLQIPILFKVKFLRGMVRPYAFVGPNIGFNLSATSTIAGVGPGVDGDTDIKANTSSTNFALDFGGGAEVKVAPMISLVGDIRYSLGLSNINSTPGVTQTSETRGFQILVGASFHIM